MHTTAPLNRQVWDLYRRLLRRCGRVSTLVERDESIPPLDRVVEEAERAAHIEREELFGGTRAAVLA